MLSSSKHNTMHPYMKMNKCVKVILMSSFSERSSKGILAYLRQWPCSGSGTRKQALKNELYIMGLQQKASVNCGAASMHKYSQHK